MFMLNIDLKILTSVFNFVFSEINFLCCFERLNLSNGFKAKSIVNSIEFDSMWDKSSRNVDWDTY